ncbi:MAG: acyl-CoA dehydratase activase-related protein, partial [Myxococcota bacterium]
CYYTQFASTVVGTALEEQERILSPLFGGPGGEKATRRELVSVLAPLLEAEPREILDAYDRALRFDLGVRRSAAQAFRERASRRKDIEVVLVGRPYTIHAPRMSKGIPRLLSTQGVAVSVQDEIPREELQRSKGAVPWELHDLPWSYASRILSVARYAAGEEGIYPVFISSFRCSPDAFVIEPFRQILDEAGKPYLILQVDDLDSAVGYETRIEAGIRAFRNHFARRSDRSRQPARKLRRSLPPSPETLFAGGEKEQRRSSISDLGKLADETFSSALEAVSTPFKSLWGHLHTLREKTLLVPRWDPLVCDLLVEMFRARGIDARLLVETPDLIARAMRHNGGQCIPVNLIAEECIDYVHSHDLDPKRTALWIAKARWACNIPMYAAFLQRILHGEGLGEIEVYRGMATFSDVDPTAPVDAYFAYLYGGLLRRFGCMIRPYEDEPGATDRAIEQAMELCRSAFRSEIPREQVLERVTELLDRVPQSPASRPKVAVFGDFYARDNDILNQGLERAIERAGGEVVTTPYSEYARIISSAHFKRLWMHGRLGEWTALKALLAFVDSLERRYRRRLSPRYRDVAACSEENLEQALSVFGMRIEQSGESFENILKVLHLRRCHPDLALFVQVNPAFCCPALVTEAMSERMEQVTGVPMVSITYDGTSSGRNHVIQPYLKHLRRECCGREGEDEGRRAAS